MADAVMILYFSATGNTKLMAKALAERLDDEAVDLLPRIKDRDYSEIRSDRPFIICSPVYVSELPSFFTDYLKKVSLAGCPDVYGVTTTQKAGITKDSGFFVPKKHNN